jgi:hypothetical protein
MPRLEAPHVPLAGFVLEFGFLDILEVAVGESCGCLNLFICQPCGFQVSGYLEQFL